MLMHSSSISHQTSNILHEARSVCRRSPRSQKILGMQVPRFQELELSCSACLLKSDSNLAHLAGSFGSSRLPGNPEDQAVPSAFRVQFFCRHSKSSPKCVISPAHVAHCVATPPNISSFLLSTALHVASEGLARVHRKLNWCH